MIEIFFLFSFFNIPACGDNRDTSTTYHNHVTLDSYLESTPFYEVVNKKQMQYLLV